MGPITLNSSTWSLKCCYSAQIHIYSCTQKSQIVVSRLYVQIKQIRYIMLIGEKSKVLDSYSTECCPKSFYNQHIFCYKTETGKMFIPSSLSPFPVFISLFSIFSSLQLQTYFLYSNMHPAFILLLPSWLILVAQRQNRSVSSLRAHDQDHECEPQAGTCTPTKSRPHARTHERQRRRDEGGESEPWGVQKRGNKNRRERMALTAWHLNRGFPLCTSSSLRSFCLHKERLIHMARTRVQECVCACMCVCSLTNTGQHQPSFIFKKSFTLYRHVFSGGVNQWLA